MKIQNNTLGYAVIPKKMVQLDTGRVKVQIKRSEHVRSYLDTPFHSIENLFIRIPEIKDKILNCCGTILQDFGPKYRCVGSRYYNKPPQSNWDLGFHQDVTINLKEKLDDPSFRFWTKKRSYYEVQPPLDILESILVLRIHLDDHSKENGALKVIPDSHQMGLIDVADAKTEEAVRLELKEGDVLQMSPLLFHASSTNSSNQNRRVIHLEFSNVDLPWFEEYSVV